MRVLQNCSGAVKTALWPDITDEAWCLVEQNVCAGALLPLVLWWRSVFSSPLIDFLNLEWTSEQLKHSSVEFVSRYQLGKNTSSAELLSEKTQLTWLFPFRPDLCWSSSAHQTLSFFYSTESFHSSDVSPCLCLSETCLFAFLWSLPSVGQFVCLTVFCSRLTEHGKVTIWRHSPMEDHCCQKQYAYWRYGWQAGMKKCKIGTMVSNALG